MELLAGVLKVGLVCGTFLVTLWVIAMSMPKSRLRSVMTELTSWAFLVFCVCWGISPIDAIPDVFFPIGFADDLGAVFLGYQSYQSAMQARRERQEAS